MPSQSVAIVYCPVCQGVCEGHRSQRRYAESIAFQELRNALIQELDATDPRVAASVVSSRLPEAFSFLLRSPSLKILKQALSGKQPKIFIEIAGEKWILKLPSARATFLPENEYLTSALGRCIGLNTPESGLMTVFSPDGVAFSVFAVKYFDFLDEDQISLVTGQQLVSSSKLFKARMVKTLSECREFYTLDLYAALRELVEDPAEVPKASRAVRGEYYAVFDTAIRDTTIFEAIKAFKEASVQRLEEVFCLIIANELLQNHDCHLENFGFTQDLVNCEIFPSPAYDLLNLSIYGSSRSLLPASDTRVDLSSKDIYRLAKLCGLPQETCKKLIHQMTDQLLLELPKSRRFFENGAEPSIVDASSWTADEDSFEVAQQGPVAFATFLDGFVESITSSTKQFRQNFDAV